MPLRTCTYLNSLITAAGVVSIQTYLAVQRSRHVVGHGCVPKEFGKVFSEGVHVRQAQERPQDLCDKVGGIDAPAGAFLFISEKRFGSPG